MSSEPLLTPRQLQTMIDASSDCIMVLDLDARLLTVNPCGLMALEIPAVQDCRLVPFTSFWRGDDRARLDAALGAARDGEARTFAGRVRTFTGAFRWWSVTVAPMPDEDGRITRLLVTARDVTAQNAAEEDRREVLGALRPADGEAGSERRRPGRLRPLHGSGRERHRPAPARSAGGGRPAGES